MRIENIIFDLDGTLVDSLPGIEYAAKSAIHSVLAESLSVVLRPFVGPPIREIFRKIFPEIEGNKLDTIVKEFRRIYDSTGWQKTVLFDGVKDALCQLKNAKIKSYVVTSKPKIPTWKILNQLQIADFFTDVISPDIVNPSFPSKSDGILYLINKFNLDNSKTLMVGDTQEDAEAANICGIPFAKVSYGYGCVSVDFKYFVDFKVNNINELLNIISQEN